MKKTFLMILLVLPATSLLVLADDGPQFKCFSPKLTSEESQKYKKDGWEDSTYDTNNKIRGTCKKIELKTVVSVDESLQKDYLLGTHSPFEYGCEDGEVGGTYACKNTKYSEELFVTGSTTLIYKNNSLDDKSITNYALFDKSYFIPLLSKMAKKSGLYFSETNIPSVIFEIYKKGEFNHPNNPMLDTLSGEEELIPRSNYLVYSFMYQEYGKYVHAPKKLLEESQYAEFEQNANMLNDNDLQIRSEFGGWHDREGTTVTSVTSPLKSVTNYWMYTKKDGKLLLQWQKSEYLLDNGKVKTVTKDDKNVNVSILLSDSADSSTISSSSSETVSTSKILGNLASRQKGESFVSKFITMILSWFK